MFAAILTHLDTLTSVSYTNRICSRCPGLLPDDHSTPLHRHEITADSCPQQARGMCCLYRRQSAITDVYTTEDSVATCIRFNSWVVLSHDDNGTLFVSLVFSGAVSNLPGRLCCPGGTICYSSRSRLLGNIPYLGRVITFVKSMESCFPSIVCCDIRP